MAVQLARVQQQARLVLGNVRPFLKDKNGSANNSQQFTEGGKRADSGAATWHLRAISNPRDLFIL